MILFLLLLSSLFAYEGINSLPMEGFDHEYHELKVFSQNNIRCDSCHNFTLDPITKKGVLKKEISASTFVKPLKELCHSCHQNKETLFPLAPQTCFTCHKSAEAIKGVKPANHKNVVWKEGHALEARTSMESCNSCHTNSECVKCHIEKKSDQLTNHSRNYRFYHSVEARLAPQKCDTCHTKSSCTKCHLTGRYE